MNLLTERMRATDYAGLMEPDQVGILLWNTRSAGAERFLAHLELQPVRKMATEIQIFVYPDDDFANLDSNKEQEAVPVPIVSGEDWKVDNETVSTRITNAKPLTELLLRPLPMWKRAIDIVASALGLIVLSPLFLVVAIVVAIDSRGPILFRQLRRGRGNRPFSMLKFRTMVNGAEGQRADLESLSEQDGPAFKLRRDPRITRVGKYLRLSCIDELPQLLNVLLGDMTIVGPRPLPLRESDQCEPWQQRRLDVTPGLTCIWQVHGKSKVSFADWMRMDIRYIRTRTFWQDCKLVLQTAVAVVLHRASH